MADHPVRKVTRQQVLDTLAACRGVRAEACRRLGISHTTLDRHINALASEGVKVPASTYSGRAFVEGPAPAIAPPPVVDPVIGAGHLDAVRSILKKRAATLDEIAQALGVRRSQALEAIDALLEQGLALHEHSGRWHWSKAPTPGHARSDHPVIRTDPDGWIRVGFTSDNHLCSKYAREDVLSDLYDKFEEEGVEIVLNAGNWIDGEARFNLHDLEVHGLEQQIDYLVRRYPQRQGIVTMAITGDDHEGWYAQREGVDVGRIAQSKMRGAGREDWIDLGFMEAFIRLEHANTGARSMLHLMHPGGGSAYAESYTVQKIVEGYDGGEKPAVLMAGHYHKLSVNYIRNVWCIQTVCTQDQTPFARKKKLRFALGGGIAELKLNQETGAVERCRTEMFNYFVRSYSNGRWSHSGAVVHADRGVAEIE